MPRFRVMLRGENFQIKFDDELKNVGFVTTRWVRAKNEEEAENLAVERIRQDKSLLNCILPTDDSNPKIYLQEIDVVSWWGLKKGIGYVFYPMEDEDDSDKDAI